MGIVLSYSLILHLVFKLLKATNSDHHFIRDILKLFNDCLSVNNKVVLAWFLSQVGIKGTEKVDELAKKALNFNILDLKVPFTDLKENVNLYFSIEKNFSLFKWMHNDFMYVRFSGIRNTKTWSKSTLQQFVLLIIMIKYCI